MLRNIGGRVHPGVVGGVGLYSGESVRLPESFREAAGSFTSSSCSTPIAASLAWPATPPCWRTIFKYRKANSRTKRSPILARRLPLTSLRSGRFPRCRARGLFPASFTTLRPGLLKSSCRLRRFALPKTPINASTRKVGTGSDSSDRPTNWELVPCPSSESRDRCASPLLALLSKTFPDPS